MNRVELEQLLSAYMDGELSPQNRKKVEALVKTNAQAKSILDGYESVRQAIQYEAKARQYKVPEGFAQEVIAAIDTAMQPAMQPPKAFESTQYTRKTQEKASRWSNPRVFAYPLVVLVCALLIGVFYRTDTSETTLSTAQHVSNPGQLVMSSLEEPIIPPPLSANEVSLSPSEISVLPEKTDLRFVCRVENMVSVSTLFTRVFAKYEVPWTKSTSGIGIAVYEISVTPVTLRKILDEFQADSVEITGDTDDWSGKEPTESIKVFFRME